MQFFAPFTGAAIGEFSAIPVVLLLIYDDLSKRAVSYREVSLLLRRPLAVKPIREMCSICTPACWNGPPR